MASVRRQFSRKFKLSALTRLAAGQSLADVARHCDVDSSVLRRWQRDYDLARESAFPGPGRPPGEWGIARIHRQIERRTKELDDLMQRIRNAHAQGEVADSITEKHREVRGAARKQESPRL